MTPLGQQPELPDTSLPGAPPPNPSLPNAAQETESDPFWSYLDVLVFAGLAVPSLLAGELIVRLAMALFHWHVRFRVAEGVPAQFLGYLVLFGLLAVLLRLEYERPFWKSLGWRPMGWPPVGIVLCGVSAAVGVAWLGSHLRLPGGSTPMTQLMENRTAVLFMAIFGITAGPLCEELGFRGLLQPLLVRSLGAFPGIVVTAIPFGFLHFYQYGNSIGYAALVSLAGVSFGWMRHATGSTKAAALMHASYNAFVMLMLLAHGEDLPKSW
ncbi:MAG: CPBP family intramembrane glutamic endopeptidase [Bryobacteraceae bacterium]|jgi:membrane protease YdiL (CAAX protease family)